ncbi:MAG: DegT/DnrJ/EryC1/StrS family aminotransferase [Desulfobulbus sp.]|jgi:dTDP-4-amino-4,6-dideoxygalactose transaminase|uniref:DegT/DnrJ/EryC1/StrS family aminotransferase n=1 Tax=Desulfobulbus sp. TaxID=895 RepID=UPI002841DE5F|nr:DegT/DnrJ/EryC1/StrS family aminotransferase [Desulfobulbus sp.]MDR2549333.1 DegT/DnrJ/EryC1/StrS family aminotransferase [Desulfobulbus sp.]
MNVPLLDLKPQLAALRPQIIEAVTRVIDSTGYILGPEVTGLERKIAQYCGTEYGVGLSSGTDALLAALMSLEIGPGDLVLTTPYTFFATMGTILRVGAQPLFVDIEPESFNIDPERVAEALAADRKNGGKIKAIIPVHLYGQCADMRRIAALAAEYGVPVIEDAAQAIGAECPYEENGAVTWKKAGSMGLCGCFSFFPSKNLGGIGDGGMLTTSDRHFVEVVLSNRNHGAEPKYYHSRVGGNFRLDPIQAAVLTVKLDHLDNWHAARRRNADRYRQLFRDTGLVGEKVALPQAVYADLPGADSHNHHIYNQFVILVSKRDELRQYLQEHSVGCEIYYPLCLHQQECLRPDQYKRQSFPVAQQAAANSLALPIFPELVDEQLVYVVETIQKFYRTC